MGVKWISLRVALRGLWNGPQKTRGSYMAMFFFSKGSKISKVIWIVTKIRVPDILSRMMKRSPLKMRWKGKSVRRRTQRPKSRKKPKTLRQRSRLRISEALVLIPIENND